MLKAILQWPGESPKQTLVEFQKNIAFQYPRIFSSDLSQKSNIRHGISDASGLGSGGQRPLRAGAQGVAQGLQPGEEYACQELLVMERLTNTNSEPFWLVFDVVFNEFWAWNILTLDFFHL